MRCSRVEKYNNRVAIGKERTRHHRCSGWNVRHLQIVDASSLVGSFLLICPSRALSRREASWLRALPKKVSYLSAVEAWILGSLSLGRSEEHTSELQSRLHLVCRLLLEKKKIFVLH